MNTFPVPPPPDAQFRKSPNPARRQSRDGEQLPLNLPAVRQEWDLISAVNYIRTIQQRVHDDGYNVTLAGGVLNNGYSTKDLDLVLIPRPITKVATHKEIVERYFSIDPNVEVFPLAGPSRAVYRVYPKVGGEGLTHLPVDLIILFR